MLKELSKYLRGKYTFVVNPVGSGSENVITWNENTKKGFDLDYNLILQSGISNNAGKIRKDFFNAMNVISADSGFEIINRKRVLEIKGFDRRLDCEISCDIAIIAETDQDRMIIVYDINTGRYIWNELENYQESKLMKDYIKSNNLMQKFREEYLKVKNNNADPYKHSYILRLEAINNTYNNFINGR